MSLIFHFILKYNHLYLRLETIAVYVAKINACQTKSTISSSREVLENTFLSLNLNV